VVGAVTTDIESSSADDAHMVARLMIDVILVQSAQDAPTHH
jgi:hypothetical protein